MAYSASLMAVTPMLITLDGKALNAINLSMGKFLWWHPLRWDTKLFWWNCQHSFIIGFAASLAVYLQLCS